MHARKALFNTLKQVKRFESLLKEVKDLVNQSIDLQFNNEMKTNNLQTVAWEFF